MELNQIEAFAGVVREGNFSRAAAKLNLTQPAVSQRIANLETAVGGRLLTRSGRQLTLTPLGKLFLPFAERLLNTVADSQRIVAQYQAGQVGHVAIASLDNLAYFMLREPMQAFRQQFPMVDVSIRIRNPWELLDLLYTGSVTLGLIGTPVWTGTLQSHARFRIPVLPVAAPNHPLARRAEPLRLADLFEHTLFRVTLSPGVTAVIEQIAEQARPGSGGAVLWLPAVMAIELLLQNQGIAMLPQNYVDDHVARGNLVFLTVQDLPQMFNQPTLVSLADSHLDQHTVRFIELIRTQWQDVLVN